MTREIEVTQEDVDIANHYVFEIGGAFMGSRNCVLSQALKREFNTEIVDVYHREYSINNRIRKPLCEDAKDLVYKFDRRMPITPCIVHVEV
jgi:hypothetical protein